MNWVFDNKKPTDEKKPKVTTYGNRSVSTSFATTSNTSFGIINRSKSADVDDYSLNSSISSSTNSRVALAQIDPNIVKELEPETSKTRRPLASNKTKKAKIIKVELKDIVTESNRDDLQFLWAAMNNVIQNRQGFETTNLPVMLESNNINIERLQELMTKLGFTFSNKYFGLQEMWQLKREKVKFVNQFSGSLFYYLFLGRRLVTYIKVANRQFSNSSCTSIGVSFNSRN